MGARGSSGEPSSASEGSWFEERDRAGLLDFWRVYVAHYDEVSRATAQAFADVPALSRIFEAPGIGALRGATRDLICRGVEAGDWAPYEAQLRALAESYARAGLTFEGWYVLTVCIADVIAPRLVAAHGNDPPRLIEALRAMRRFLDRKRVLLSTEFMSAKERALAESERRMRALAARLQSAIEDERKRIAREVHDQLGQQLTALKLDWSWVLRRYERRDRSVIAEQLAGIDHLIDAMVETVRRLATDLRPDILDELGLFAALEWQARAVERRTGIQIDVGLPDEEIDVPDEQATALFRMFQEILTNVARHAGAQHASVRVEVSEASIVLDVRDDGRGITADEAARSTSLGLLGMRERAALLGGRVEIDGAPGRGTTVRVHVPLPAGAAA